MNSASLFPARMQETLAAVPIEAVMTCISDPLVVTEMDQNFGAF